MLWIFKTIETEFEDFIETEFEDFIETVLISDNTYFWQYADKKSL